MTTYEMSDEQRRIIMVALAGFELENEERATIRPLLLRMIRDFDPTLIKSSATSRIQAGVQIPGPPFDLRTATALTGQAVVLQQIALERERQDCQWGGSSHDDSHERKHWLNFIDEHNARAKAVLTRKTPEYRKQLVEIAALAVAAIEAHDRKMLPKRTAR